MPFLAVIVGVACLAPVARGSERLVIVDRGTTRYEIVTARDALPTTRLAAKELQHFLGQASGVTLPIVSMASRNKHQIFIAGVGGLKPHGFTIEARGKNIYLSGRDSGGSTPRVDCIDPIHRGTCNAVYEFLERFMGVRWFWGDDLGDVVPKMSRITVPATINIRQEPFFDYRALPYGPAGSFHGNWARRNRLGSATTMHHAHAQQDILPIDEWALRGHPEYAAMRGGKRRVGKDRGYNRGHLCTSNPEVVRIVADAARSFLTKHPERTMYSISPPDGSGLCRCERCASHDVPGYKIEEGVRRGRPIATDGMLHFYNAVAEIVAKDHPDRLLGGLIYNEYLYPPRREERAHEMLALVVAPNLARQLWNDRTWDFWRDLYRRWNGFHDRIYAYDICYFGSRQLGLPAPLGERTVDLIRFHAEAGTKGCYLYIGPSWEALGPDAYLMTRLLWNPRTDVERTKNEYFGILYQQAAPAARSYFDTAEECWRSATTHAPEAIRQLAGAFHRTKPYAREAMAKLIVGYGPRLASLGGHVTEAERLAADDPLLRQRVARLRDTHTLTVCIITGLQSVVAYEQDGAKDTRRLAPLGNAIREREALLRRIGPTYAGELAHALRWADDTLNLPLKPGGYYHRLSAKAD